VNSEPDYRVEETQVVEAIERLLAARSPAATICPSEAARALAPENWRALMPQVREVARGLALQGRVVITQRGQHLDATLPWRGAIRIGVPRRESS